MVGVGRLDQHAHNDERLPHESHGLMVLAYCTESPNDYSCSKMHHDTLATHGRKHPDFKWAVATTDTVQVDIHVIGWQRGMGASFRTGAFGGMLTQVSPPLR